MTGGLILRVVVSTTAVPVVEHVLIGECATVAGCAAGFALVYLCRALHAEETALPFLSFRRRSYSHEHNDTLISNGRQLTIQRSSSVIFLGADDAAGFVARKQNKYSLQHVTGWVKMRRQSSLLVRYHRDEKIHEEY